MFVIIYGRRTREHLEATGLFNCPSCRRRQPASLFRLERVAHLFFFPIGSGELLAKVYCCHGCQREFNVEESRAFNFSEGTEANPMTCPRCYLDIPGHLLRCPSCGEELS